MLKRSIRKLERESEREIERETERKTVTEKGRQNEKERDHFSYV